MNHKRILSILVIVFFISTTLSVISLLYVVNKTTISGKATSSQGAISLIVNEAEKEPSPAAGAGGLSGGGGVATPSIREADLIFSETTLKIITKINRPLTKELTITNPSSSAQQVLLEVHQLSDKITPSESQFTVFPDETKTITLTILSEELGVETGTLAIKTTRKTYGIPIILETESERVLFDVSLEVKPKTLPPGEEIIAQTIIYNINDVGLVDIELSYFIKDFNNKIILQDKESITLETQATTSKTFKLPQDITEGDYVLIVQVSYQDSLGTASEAFIVKKIEKPFPFNIYTIITIILIIIFIIILLLQKRSLLKKIEQYEDQPKEKLREVRVLVQNYLASGHSKKQVKKDLRKKGWPKDIIARILK